MDYREQVREDRPERKDGDGLMPRDPGTGRRVDMGVSNTTPPNRQLESREEHTTMDPHVLTLTDLRATFIHGITGEAKEDQCLDAGTPVRLIGPGSFDSVGSPRVLFLADGGNGCLYRYRAYLADFLAAVPPSFETEERATRPMHAVTPGVGTDVPRWNALRQKYGYRVNEARADDADLIDRG